MSFMRRGLNVVSVALLLLAVGCNEALDTGGGDGGTGDTGGTDNGSNDNGTGGGTTTTVPAGAGFVQIIQPSPNAVALRGYTTANLTDYAKVGVRVLDFNGVPVSGHTVNFRLTNTIGDSSLTWSSINTNSEGEAYTWLLAGSVPGVTQVEFRMDILGVTGNVIEVNRHVATTQPINMSTAVPVTDGISLSTNVYNPEGYNFDGVPVTITAHLGDMHRNPVADGTIVNFLTNSGMVESSCATSNGACSVEWRSAAPRSADGRVYILARTEGNDAFIDLNGNSRFDIGEDYTPQGEPFVDADGSGNYTAGEFFWDRDQAGNYTAADPAALYRGFGCSNAALGAGHCAERADVFDGITLVNSGSFITLSPAPTAIAGSQTVTYTMVDQNGNVPPVGSTLTASCDGDANVDLWNDTVPGNPGSAMFSGWPVEVTYDVTGAANCTITVQSPNGLGVRYMVAVN
ncbi:hypothetical protein NFC81_14430 [Salinispirillum sp. LH 10-3-1]|uniref:Big-1 domain-containing protein n=1 Tax=Salinispirillum sp. LH 10-3-1 TaxID=2952525 RepID=A0AB38YEV9_9GAMM